MGFAGLKEVNQPYRRTDLPGSFRHEDKYLSSCQLLGIF
jgi:hypothetical protein